MDIHHIQCRELLLIHKQWFNILFSTLNYVLVLFSTHCSSTVLNIEFFCMSSSVMLHLVIRVLHFYGSAFKESQVSDFHETKTTKIRSRKFGLSNLTSIAADDAVGGSSKMCSTALIMWGYFSTGWLLQCLFARCLLASVMGRHPTNVPQATVFAYTARIYPKV